MGENLTQWNYFIDFNRNNQEKSAYCQNFKKTYFIYLLNDGYHEIRLRLL